MSTSNTPAQTGEKKSGNPLWNYLKGAISELRKVSWPSRQETWKKSMIVISFSAVFAVFLGGLDYLLNKLLEILL